MPALLLRWNHRMMNAPAHNSPGPLQRTALRSCGCHTKEFDPGAAPIFRTSTIKTSVTSLESHHLQTPTALSPRNLFRTLMGLEKLTARIKKKNHNNKFLAYLIWQQEGLVVFITKERGMVQL